VAVCAVRDTLSAIYYCTVDRLLLIALHQLSNRSESQILVENRDVCLHHSTPRWGGGSRRNIAIMFGMENTSVVWLPDGENILKTCLFVSTEYTKGKKERIVLSEIHSRTTGRHLLLVTCHPTEVTAPPSPQPGRLVLDLSTP